MDRVYEMAPDQSASSLKIEERSDDVTTGNDDVTAKTSFEGFYQDNRELKTIPAKELIMLTSKFSK